MSLFAEVVATLEERGARAALVGAEALAWRGVSRATADRDLLTTDPRALDTALWARLTAAAADVEVRRGDDEDPLAGVVRFRRGGERDVDLVVGRAGWMTELVARAEPVDFDGTRVGLPSAADLVLLKLYAGGPQDSWDIVQLLATPEREAIVAQVEPRLAQLPGDCRALWTRIRDDLR